MAGLFFWDRCQFPEQKTQEAKKKKKSELDVSCREAAAVFFRNWSALEAGVELV